MTDASSLLQERYRLVRSVTDRGASRTWEAVDERTGDRCVVKELSVGAVVREGSTTVTFDGDDFTKVIDLFEREARVLSHLDHPAVPGLIDHFRVDSDGDTRLYTVQEFVEGDTIEALVESGRHFTEEEAVAVLSALVDVLDYLHDRSPPLVHRDIKPSNVIVAPDGTVHLVDFGSVRDVLDREGLDGKTIVGTYGYMPIEQYEARAVPQSDFYSLGMTLVYLLSHRDPTRIARVGLTLDFRPHVHVSGRLADVLEWMIRPAPDDRPPDAAAIRAALAGTTPVDFPAAGTLAELDAQLARLPELALGSERGGRALDRARHRHRTLLTVAALVAAILAGLGALLMSAAPGVAPDDARTTPSAPGGDLPPTPSPVVAVDGVVSVDLDRDFGYIARGWPMGRSVAQTSLPPLTAMPPAGLTLPPGPEEDDLLFGQIVLGNTDDDRIDFALAERGGVWSLFLDANDNEDLGDDGPARANEGSGPLLATAATVEARVRRSDGTTVVRPYALWIWFTDSGPEAPPRGRFYARHHYRGAIEIAGERFVVTAFEFSNHDALLRESGICVDLNSDDSCQEDLELFRDGDVIRTSRGEARLVLDYS